MSRVSDSLIEQAWNEVSAASSSTDKLSELMSRFGDEQTSVFEFVSEAASNWGDDARDLVFHASLVIWLSFVSARTESEPALESVLPESLIRNYQQNLEWLDQQQGEVILIQKKLSDFSRFSEPELMRYAVELIFEAHEDGLEIEPEEQQELLLILKTLIDAFAG